MSDGSDHSKNLAATAFDQAMPWGAPSAGTPDDTIEALIAAFEAAAQVDDEDNEFWFARDLQVLFDYAKWDNFIAVAEKAKIACEQAGR